MYSVNIILKILTVVILTIVSLLIDSYYLFWLLLFYLLLLSIIDRNIRSLLCNFLISLILLFVLYTSKTKILIQLLFIVNIIILFIYSFTKKDRDYLSYKYMYRYNKSSRKKIFYNKYLDKIVKYNKEQAIPLYGENIIINDKVKKDMEDFYLYGKVRFYGFRDKVTTKNNYKWNIYDIIFLIVLIILIILMIVFWQVD